MLRQVMIVGEVTTGRLLSFNHLEDDTFMCNVELMEIVEC